MTMDEDGTVVALDAARAVFKARIEGNQGRVIDMAGDSVLAVFETAVGAVSAALAIQSELNVLADAMPEERRMRFRIGVHLGDVIEKADGTIYGDGVNIAARLQALAESGGVTVSGMVQEAVRDRISASFEDQGEHEVKNIARPVHAYRVDFRAHGDAAAFGTAKKVVQPERRRRWRIASAVALLLAAAIGAWIAIADSASDARGSLMSVFGYRSSQGLSVRATIAVMPFSNLSGDAKRDYFSDGITEDIISALGRFSGLMVISQNAVRDYKGKTSTPQALRTELGARYIVQGSIREADGKLRAAVELSDADKGVLLWAERYDGEGTELFAIQDRIVKNIVASLQVRLTQLEQLRVFTKPTESLEAYDLVLRARWLLNQVDRSANREARALLARARDLAPEYAEILTTLGEAELQRALYGWIEDPAEAMRRAEELGKRALASVDPRAHARAHALIAGIYSNLGRFEEALGHAERAVELNASDTTALHRRGGALLYVGRIGEAIAVLETAKRIDPDLNGLNLAVAYYVAGRYREALAQADVVVARFPGDVALHAIRAAALSQLGNADEARRAADQVRRFSPSFQVEYFGMRFADPKYTAKLHEGLHNAGL